MDDRELYGRARALLLRETSFFAATAPSSRLLTLPGVVFSVVPAAPDRSMLNWVVYDRLESLLGSHDELAAAYEAAGVRAWAVWVDPGDGAAAGALVERGYKLDAEPIAMAAEVPSLTLAPAGDLDWSVTRELGLVGRINDLAYGFPPPAFEASMTQWPPGGSPWRAYVARLAGEPVCGLLVDLDGQGDCGVSAVATVPAARGRGLATRLLSAALREAAGRGAATTSLQASPTGRGIYRALGYRELGTMAMWEWRRPS